MQHKLKSEGPGEHGAACGCWGAAGHTEGTEVALGRGASCHICPEPQSTAPRAPGTQRNASGCRATSQRGTDGSNGLRPDFWGLFTQPQLTTEPDYSGTLLWRGRQKQSHGTCWRARACGRTPAAPRARCQQLYLTTASRGPSQQCQPHCTPTQAMPTAPEPRCSFPGAHGGMQGGVAHVCPWGSSKALLFARGPTALQLLSLVVRPTPDPQVPDTGPEPCLQLCALGGCVWHPLLGCRPGHPVVRLAGTALPSPPSGSTHTASGSPALSPRSSSAGLLLPCPPDRLCAQPAKISCEKIASKHIHVCFQTSQNLKQLA